MSKCGIEKYDELPGRVALIDVDAARAALSTIESDGITSKLWLWHPLGPFAKLFYDKEDVRQKIVEDLEEARKIHSGEMKPVWNKYTDKLPSF